MEKVNLNQCPHCMRKECGWRVEYIDGSFICLLPPNYADPKKVTIFCLACGEQVFPILRGKK